MAVTLATFVQDFPEFSNQTYYPASAFAYWANLGNLLLSQQRFGTPSASASSPPTTMFDIALELFVAHNLVIEKQNADAAANNAAPGISQGPVASKSVGPVSVSYDTQAGIDPNAGHWNLTTYGTRLWNLFQMFGAGPIQITGCPGPSVPGFGSPWLGPVIDQGFAW